MKFLFLYLISIIKICFSTNKFFNLFHFQIYQENIGDINKIMQSLDNYLDKTFPNYKTIPKSKLLECFNDLFQKRNGLETFIHSLSYSGNDFSDLGNENTCIDHNFSYYLLSYIYDYHLKNTTDNYNSKIFEFFEKKNFYTGLCLPNTCGILLHELFKNYEKDIKNVKIKEIIKDSSNCSDKNFCESDPYYSFNKEGNFDENITLEEKGKYTAFLVLFWIFLIILGFETLMSLLFILIPNILDKGKILNSKLYEGTDYDDEDEEGTYDEPSEKLIYNNTDYSNYKNNYCGENLIKFLYKYTSVLTNIMILTLRKSLYYNNKNMEIIYKLKIFCLILITFSTNLDVYIQLPSRGFFDEFFYNEIYFFFTKFSSFGLDMYICLEGFEALYKFMNYYKKYFFDLGYKKMSWFGLMKFYLYSVYKIISFIFIFFVVIYFSRYFIYMHYGGKLYSYYADDINNEIILSIFNPRYSILSYFFNTNNNDTYFLFKSKMQILFVLELFFFLIIIFIFFIGIRLNSKIYDLFLILFLIISFGSSYLCDYIDKNNKNELYNYNKITQNISLIKYPHIFMNHYLIGAFTGIICFYLKDFEKNNNSMMNDRYNCPFNTLFGIIEFFDYLNQKGRKIAIFIAFVIQLLICFIYTILINIKNKGEEKKNYIISLELTKPIKTIFYYESGVFIFCFCFITILLFIKNLDKKNYDNNSILYLLFQINFSFVNTVYLLMYTFYCYYEIQFKLTYQNLWLSTFGFFFLFCIENLIITMLLVMPFKMLSRFLLNKIPIFDDNRLKTYSKSVNNDTILNKFNDNFQEDYLDN